MSYKVASVPDKIYLLVRNTQQISFGSRYDPVTKRNKKVQYTTPYPKSINIKSSKDKTLIEVTNTPFKGVKIIDNKSALIDNKYWVDIDYDFIMDVVQNVKINKGLICADFIWCLVGSKVKLVRLGSGLHKHVLDAERRSSKPKIKKCDFEPGAIYATPSGKKSVFLGKINTEEVEYNWNTKQDTSLVTLGGYLFYNCHYMNSNKINFSQTGHWIMPIKHNHSFVEKVGKVKIPKNVISVIRNEAIKKMKDFILNHKDNTRWILSEYKNKTIYINMYESNKDKPEKFDINKYLTFM